MRSTLFVASLVSAFGLALLGLATPACDPDLNVVKSDGGDGDGGPGSVKPSPTGDAANPSSSSGSSGSSSGDGGESDATPDDDSGPTITGHKIDGINDFAANEKLATTSLGSGYEAYIAWDATRLIFGMSGNDVGSKASNKWVLVYLGVPGTTGTKTGINYGGSQQPTLPFDATHHVRWKASGDFTTVEVWDSGSSTWKGANTALIPVPIYAQQGTFMEMSISRTAIGATGLIDVHMNMLIEGGGADWTYAGVPSTSFTDGKNAQPTKYFELDLADTTKAPNAYAPK